MIADLYELTGGRIPLIGVGGIFTAEDAWEKIAAGASLVQLYTGFIYQGPGIAQRSTKDWQSILAREGFANLDAAVGCRSRVYKITRCHIYSRENLMERNVVKDKLIVALDVETPAKALDLVRQLHSVAGMFKVGSQLFTAAGPQIVSDIIALDSKVFLDLKFHDIPHQVAGAARSAAELGVSLFTVHASGGSEMMRRAVESVAEVAERKAACARQCSPSAFSPASTQRYFRKLV